MKCLIPALMLLTTSAFATGVPESFKVTADNASSLGFEIDDLGMGEKPNYKMGTLKFPNTIDGYVAARIQTYLRDFSGVYVTTTSSDAFISDKSPRVLFSYSGDVQE
ncbi:hypothetical protein [Shewanella violacea]|uniref:Uncharacterized protein n=1 Tax=Shewanella violacea (strain JCM 10179 / CIP 106290 / LMG 19151 / DSS12) TaxID=637905 RepID=D4ZL71_SHEVD|nr:hypothetical protein [Shewanella violacea]BAJ02420.1 hypothetical protein SVI_2449 [Shewanella violacea DSS12]